MKKPFLTMLTLFSLLLFAAHGWALSFSGDGSILGSNAPNGQGSYTGELNYSAAANGKSATLTIELENTSSDFGYLVGFVFNLPDSISLTTDTTLTPASYTAFKLVGGTSFDNSVSASPYGDFDIGAVLDGDDFNGAGGSPNDGIPSNGAETFTFDLKGTGLGGGKGANDFVNALSENPGGGGSQWFVARFKGFPENGQPGSDKVPATPVPEAATILLLGLGFMGTAVINRRKIKK